MSAWIYVSFDKLLVGIIIINIDPSVILYRTRFLTSYQICRYSSSQKKNQLYPNHHGFIRVSHDINASPLLHKWPFYIHLSNLFTLIQHWFQWNFIRPHFKTQRPHHHDRPKPASITIFHQDHRQSPHKTSPIVTVNRNGWRWWTRNMIIRWITRTLRTKSVVAAYIHNIHTLSDGQQFLDGCCAHLHSWCNRINLRLGCTRVCPSALAWFVVCVFEGLSSCWLCLFYGLLGCG